MTSRCLLLFAFSSAALCASGCAAPASATTKGALCPATTTTTSASTTVTSAPSAPSPSSPRVTGIGGIFFKAKDSKGLTAWYVENLGLPPAHYGVHFKWHPDDAPTEPASTTWSTFPEKSSYYEPTKSRFLINYRVVDLDGMLARLRRAGARVDEKIVEDANGRFGWATDPEGNRFELWEPKPGY